MKRQAHLITFPSGKTIARSAHQPAEPSALVSNIRRLETERPNAARVIEHLVDGVIKAGPITATSDQRLRAMALGNKMQILALVNPRALRVIEKIVDEYVEYVRRNGRWT